MASQRLEFLNGVTKLHSFYTEQVRMLAKAYDLSTQDAAMLLDSYGYHNVARSILASAPDELASEEINEATGK